MRKLMVAAAIAMAAITSTFGAANAQSVVITDDNGPQYHHRYYDHDRHWDRDWHRPRYQRARCMTKTVEVHRNGHTMVKETRMCH
ncbi:hypothetical protein DTW90_31775 [Neorhizobium sp. P12A]|uniref:hypothetical protein n=1 Tax=Rhizobium/Agrobacterium group TaxID=227290 RepID=UPI0010512480|nr:MULTISPECIES: hypothetical protein [Rhizobium/Agrobacterium group]KAA0689468.1 hypothetical protein DTW90_31775 [Neorhizobium sp. P12A]TCR74101.1 hypothetical protein EV561_12469 [Rhizobium sp. BK376]